MNSIIPNLFAGVPASLPEEWFEMLVDTPAVRIERIVSTGQGTPAGQWYDQERDEWVALLKGQASLSFADGSPSVTLNPGDHLLIPAHRKHRVEWTSADEKTIWLAVHFDSNP